MRQCRYTWNRPFDKQPFARESDATIAASLISRGFADEDEGRITVQVTTETFPFPNRAVRINIMGAMILPGIKKSRQTERECFNKAGCQGCIRHSEPFSEVIKLDNNGAASGSAKINPNDIF